MQNARIDYTALNGALSHYKLPGGIEMSDFQRYYVVEAAKAYMGLESDFGKNQDGSTKSRNKMLEQSIPILRYFNILNDSDPSHDLSLKFNKVRSIIGDEKMIHNKYFKEAISKIQEADHILDKAL